MQGGIRGAIRRVGREAGEDDVLGEAAKVAYFMFVSLPPALLVVFGLSGLFGGDQLAAFLTSRIQAALPGTVDAPNSAAAFIIQFVDQVVTESAPAPLSIGLVLGVWASSAVFVALTTALNKAWEIEESRSWVRRRVLAVAVMLAFLALFLSGSFVVLAGPRIAEWLGFGALGIRLWEILQWPLALILVVAAIVLVYYVLPNRSSRAWRWSLLLSAAIAGGLWVIATLGFRIYIANFGSYGETYGFVGGILVLLLWMYMTAIVILVGAEIGSELERSV